MDVTVCVLQLLRDGRKRIVAPASGGKNPSFSTAASTVRAKALQYQP